MQSNRDEKRKREDKADDIIARRKSADDLAEANSLIQKVKNRLRYTKGDSVDIKLTLLSGELNDVIITLRDPECDPE